MSKSWNWQTIAFSAGDTDHYKRMAETAKPEYRHFYLCRKKGCGALPEVYVAYHYFTGRQGRVSYQMRPFCKVHGEQAVAAHSKSEAA